MFEFNSRVQIRKLNLTNRTNCLRDFLVQAFDSAEWPVASEFYFYSRKIKPLEPPSGKQRNKWRHWRIGKTLGYYRTHRLRWGITLHFIFKQHFHVPHSKGLFTGRDCDCDLFVDIPSTVYRSVSLLVHLPSEPSLRWRVSCFWPVSRGYHHLVLVSERHPWVESCGDNLFDQWIHIHFQL